MSSDNSGSSIEPRGTAVGAEIKEAEPPAKPAPAPNSTANDGVSWFTSSPDTEKRSAARNWLLRFLGNEARSEREDERLRETLESLIENATGMPEQASVVAHERALLSNILKLRDLTLVDVMVPRADIVAIPLNSEFQDVMRVATTQPHSRFPIYGDSMDDMRGFIHIKDLLGAIVDPKRFALKDIMREVMVVAPSMRMLDLLYEMRQRHVHIALVVDEFGGIDGLVTIEDLVEEITGEIQDEHDFISRPSMKEDKDGSYIADARLELDDFEKALGEVLDDSEREEADTIGGLVFHLAGEVPSRGALIKHDSGLKFEVVSADPRRIRKLRIHLPKKKKKKKPPA